MAPKRRSPKRYTPDQKQRILVAARKEGLTGAQVKERFGVSTLTFYRWRGPVGRGRRAQPQPHGLLETAEIDVVALREEVRRALHKVLPQVVQEEIEAYLAALLRSG
jgi:transposase-like protein